MRPLSHCNTHGALRIPRHSSPVARRPWVARVVPVQRPAVSPARRVSLEPQFSQCVHMCRRTSRAPSFRANPSEGVLPRRGGLGLGLGLRLGHSRLPVLPEPEMAPHPWPKKNASRLLGRGRGVRGTGTQAQAGRPPHGVCANAAGVLASRMLPSAGRRTQDAEPRELECDHPSSNSMTRRRPSMPRVRPGGRFSSSSDARTCSMLDARP
ncbi:hypothetical protein C8Q78DRAFT_425769 [Trametes maxima]|nr:hypothetical protein C8Q78DRAFT_425769 [Trametes maxima]